MLKYNNIAMIPSYSKITKTTKNCNIQWQAYLDGLKGILTESLLIPSCSNETIFKQKFSVNSSLLLTGYWWSVLPYEQKIAFLYIIFYMVYIYYRTLPSPGFRIRIRLDPVFLYESGSGFQFSPDPGAKKGCRKGSKSYL